MPLRWNKTVTNPSCTIVVSEAFIFNVRRSCTPVRVRYTTKGTRKIRVPLRVPLYEEGKFVIEFLLSFYFQGFTRSCTLIGQFEEPTSPVEHIVHIDGANERSVSPVGCPAKQEAT